MSLWIYDPFRNSRHWDPFREMDHLVGELLSDRQLMPQAALGELHVGKDDFAYSVDVAGFKPEELKVDLDGDSLVVSADHRESTNDESVHRSFVRKFTIPKEVRKETIKCDIDSKGHLRIHGAKLAIEDQQKRQIPIEFKSSNKPAIEKNTQRQLVMPTGSGFASNGDFVIEDDFERAISLLINSTQQQQQNRRRELGESIFSRVPEKKLVEYFTRLLKHIQKDEKLMIYTVKNEVKLPHVFAQCFFNWTLSIMFSKKNEKRKALMTSEAKKETDQNGTDSMTDTDGIFSNEISCPFDFSDKEKFEIIKTIGSAEFPPYLKILNLAMKALCIPPTKVIETIKELADVGQASFSSLVLILSEVVFNTLTLWDDLLPQCILLGKVSANQIESYASPLSEEKRNQTRETLLNAELVWQQTMDRYTEMYRKYTHRQGKPDPPFDVFRNNLLELMSDLRQQNTQGKFIDAGMAIGIIKATLAKRFKKKEVNDEQLLDLIYHVIQSRPSIKSTVIKLLEKNYNQQGIANMIKKFDPRRGSLPNLHFADVNLHEASSPQFLALPKEINVKFVDKPNQLKVLSFDLSKLESSNYPYVGLDTEWSPYLVKSRASILQLALRDIVYLIDMDACSGTQELEYFLDKLFNNEKLIKIGFKFTEDLHQLRGCSPRCTGLYRPKNLICIQSLFNDLVKISTKEVGSLAGFLKPSNVPFEPDPEIAQLQAELDDPGFVDENPFRTPEMKSAMLRDLVERDKLKKNEMDNGIVQHDIKFMGLSAVCVRILGKSLDKSEQCSVWNRRPLRMRYAALDAYCMLMLMDKFIDWCEEKKLDLKKLIASQPPTTIAFPLFFSVM
ncbi:hypothetical protein FO519_002333 [Halicephalobus sp. NKZ332]|nr:hypothetical protein FO519_002333 [Halicephalobus sp. NKZ332]